MTTANFTIDPEDGWVAVTSAATDFVMIGSNVPNHAFFVTSASSTPSAVETGATYATGAITFSGQPSDTETITVGSVTFTFKTSATLTTDVQIGSSAEETLDNLLAKISAQVATVAATKSGTTIINLQAISVGTAGNSIVLTEAATNVTVSGSGTLSGGAAAIPPVVGFKVACDDPFKVNVPNTDKYYVRAATNVPGATRIDVFYILS